MECDKAMVHKKQARCFFFFFKLKIEARFLLKKKKKKEKKKRQKLGVVLKMPKLSNHILNKFINYFYFVFITHQFKMIIFVMHLYCYICYIVISAINFVINLTSLL